MHCVKLLGQSLSARDFHLQVVEFQVRFAVLNGFTALGTPITEAKGQVCPGKGEHWPSPDLCNRAVPMPLESCPAIAEDFVPPLVRKKKQEHLKGTLRLWRQSCLESGPEGCGRRQDSC